ncbi:hypothetical protein SLEP1_g4184 [Rubroshorea leprosula]|uniref:Uncharacterized protein n=1 Tax=Rubroshorea leprosula TaxID=152421 RepID=A0AAV5HYC4_9ROSI|nr:hypothetical protein SLEP1_g4184 [Rubroshorea leprosula]
MSVSDHIISQTNTSNPETTVADNLEPVRKSEEDEEQQLHKLLLPDVRHLPLSPPSAVDSNFVSYYARDFMKLEHDQYIYRHANG